MKGKLEKFGKFEIKNSLMVTGGQKFMCSDYNGGTYIREDDGGKDCIPYFEDAI